MHWKRVKRVVAASAVLAGVTAGLPSPAEATSASSTQACSTWQYEVASWGTIRNGPGGAKTGYWAKPGDLVNVHAFSGPWYRGNFYTPSRVRYYDGGWILSNHLAYKRCW